MAYLVKFRRWDKQRCICVPQPLRKLLGWNLGDALSIDVRDGVLIVQRVTMPKCPAVTRELPAAEVAQ